MPTDREFAKAKSDGLEVVLPASDQLQLDIDRPWPCDSPTMDQKIKEVRQLIHNGDAKMISVLHRFDEEFSVQRHEAWRSIGGNIHVIFTLKRDLELLDRIALSLLGSDLMRELCNLRRVRCGAEDPIALFRPINQAL